MLANSALMNIVWLQHVPFEGPGLIAPWMQTRGHKFRKVALWAGDVLPDVNDVDGLVIMGGPMNADAHDAYPWLASETAFIGKTIASGKPVLGICLGAQLMARALGATVHAGHAPEIGWFPTRVVVRHPLLAGVPDSFDAYHWHSDTFDIPAGATRLLESDACANQGFVFGKRALALQCHLETTPASARDIIANTTWTTGPTAQSAATMLQAHCKFEALQAMMDGLLQRLFTP